MGYNPADYAAVENTAKAMSKPELEEQYVNEKNRYYSSTCGKIFGCLLVALAMFAIGALGYNFALDDIQANMQNVAGQVADDVCPFMDNEYFAVDLKGVAYDFGVDCSAYRSE